MNENRRVGAYAVALTMIGVALVWLVGAGQANQGWNAEDQRVESLYVDRGTEDTTDVYATREKTILHYSRLLVDMAYNIHSRYMEDVSPKDLAYSGIRGMLDDLDPFSVLMEKKSYDQLMETSQGRYEGLGMQIGKRGDFITIIAPMEGTPAYRTGLQAGDLVIAIDGEDTKDMTTEEASGMMRGPAGTSVTLTVRRPGYDEDLDYTITRAEIPLHSVNYAGTVDDDIGYIRLSRFSETTEDELRAAIDSLQHESDLTGLILDLRSNPGGLLPQAIRTANLFLEKNKLVVYTRGRLPSSERKYSADLDPMYADRPLVVLVDPGSASASEIVAGAIQDWDRGIIIGNTTFGKGLVQQIFSGGEDNDIALKLTISKYYVPSGRCIQKPERSKKHPEDIQSLNADGDEEVDPEKEVFYTNGGRVVYGGGGIVPDIEVDREKAKPIEINLVRQSMFFNFAVEYLAEHSGITRDIEITDEMFEEFRDYCKEQEFDYKSQLELSLERFEQTVTDAEKSELFDKDIKEIDAIIQAEKDNDFDESEEFIKRTLKRELVEQQFGERGVYEELVLKTDPYVKKALEVLRAKDEYSKLLKPRKDLRGES